MDYDSLKYALDLELESINWRQAELEVEQRARELFTLIGPCTNSQRGGLVGLVKQGMEDPDDDEIRHAVVSTLVNRNIHSFRDLSFWEASSLILALKDEHEQKWRLSNDGQVLIFGAETRAASSSGIPGSPEEDPLEEEDNPGSARMPNVQQGNLEPGRIARGLPLSKRYPDVRPGNSPADPRSN